MKNHAVAAGARRNLRARLTEAGGGCGRGAAAMLIVLGLLGANPTAVRAQDSTVAESPATETLSAVQDRAGTVLTVALGTSAVVDHPVPLERVSIADPNVADAVVVAGGQVVVNGKSIGNTTLLLWDEGGGMKAYSVQVTPDAESLNSVLTRMFPGQGISASAFRNSIVLTGNVSDPMAARRAVEMAQTLGEGVAVMDHIAVPDRGQVLLEVRFAEVNRSALRELGANFARVDPSDVRGDDEAAGGTGGAVPFSGNFLGDDDAGPDQSFSDAVNLFLFHNSTNLSAFIQALKTRGLFKTLAEPNLLAVSGEEASFLAGGEFPYPVLQGGAAANAVTIQFREFGVRLNFTPDIVNSGAIRLRVAPEVSTLDFANGLQVSGFRIPALRSRKAATVIELRDGQTFAIAGLVDNSLAKSSSRIPLLGDLPILGMLFRSEEIRQNRSELLVLVTPRIVKAMDESPAIPTGEPETWQWHKSLREPVGQAGGEPDSVPAVERPQENPDEPKGK